MQKRLEKWMPWAALLGVSALALGVVLALADAVGWLPGSGPRTTPQATSGERSPDQQAETDSQVLRLVKDTPADRAEALVAIAAQPPSRDQVRARYLLATDLIDQGQGGQALPLLETLAADYPLLAAHSRVKTGIAQKASGQADAAQQTWLTVLETHGDHPAAAEALYQLGSTGPQYWDQLLEQFPAYPRSVDIAYQRLGETPAAVNEKALLLIMARHGLYYSDIVALVDRLVETYGPQLTPEEWRDVGFAYWETLQYEAAGNAYSQAPATPQARYRAARGLQIGGQRTRAIAAYQTLIAQFPTAPETATGILRLAELVETDTALPLLDQVIQTFPAAAAEATVEKAQLLDRLNSPETAANLRQQVLTEYSTSEAAAELRARFARNAGAAGNWSEALTWASQLLVDNRDAEMAAEIGFWAGKWAQKAGQTQAALQRFEQVVQTYPESYFAWRSAVALGWDVGDFHTVRSRQPALLLPERRVPLPAGSDVLQELYLLGQDWDAWATWQIEFPDPQTPSMEAQFTDGVMRVGVGDNLDGIFMMSSLAWRDRPTEQATLKTLKQHPAYWQTLYPFLYAEPIARWSAQQDLNPLLVTALIRQESRFEPQIRSVVGAVGLMQVMPATAEWIQLNSDISNYTLDNPEDNIRLGTWYLDYTHSEYNNHSLYAVASYNAGPGNVADWLARRNYSDVDDFVDKIPFPETKGYVQAVFGGYWNYLRLYNPDAMQRLEQSRQS